MRVINHYHVGRGSLPATAISIMRPSIWGNPFLIGRDGTREEVIAKYRSWILKQDKLLAQLHELRGKTLVCCCKPHACHGDVLVELVQKLRGDVLPRSARR